MGTVAIIVLVGLLGLLIVHVWALGRAMARVQQTTIRAIGHLEELVKSDQARTARHEAIRTAITSPDHRERLRARVAERLGKGQ